MVLSYENHPDDGLSIPAICPQYTTETEGGHLGSISAGGIRVSKAFWVLMARLAGWDGTVTSTSSHVEENFRLFPNPASRKLFLELPAAYSDGIFTVFSVEGRILKQGLLVQEPGESTGVMSIPLKNLAPGFYVVQIAQGHHRILRKFIVK